jgi:hypothetical protein
LEVPDDLAAESFRDVEFRLETCAD